MKNLNSTSLAVLCLSTLSMLTTPESRAAELVTNGGFETGTFSSWTVVDPSNFTNVGSDPTFAHSGTYHANLGARGTIGSLSQLLSPTAGTTYTLSFFLANDGVTSSNFFQALFNGVPLVTLNNAGPLGYTRFLGSFIGTGAPGLLEFRYQNDADFFRLDDVSVNVPDLGSTASLALPVFASLALLHSFVRRRGAGSAA
jgi:hypothetical protein